jgi:hypothetical protein
MHIRSWRTCGYPIAPSLTGRQRGKRSTTFVHQTQAKSGLGVPSGRQCPRKAGSWTEPLTWLWSPSTHGAFRSYRIAIDLRLRLDGPVLGGIDHAQF